MLIPVAFLLHQIKGLPTESLVLEKGANNTAMKMKEWIKITDHKDLN
jgi:hypothetical protein